MKIKYGPAFYKFYKKANVRIQHSFDDQLRVFKKDPNDPSLNNHELKREWEGFRSIDITGDFRAIYQEIKNADGPIAYFVALGTHKDLYISSAN